MASTVEPAASKPTASKSTVGRSEPKRRGSRRSGRTAPGGVRYFVGRPDAEGKPTLEQEVASEPEALVIAFKSDIQVYLISQFRVAQRIERNQVRLEKEPAESVSTGSILNAS